MFQHLGLIGATESVTSSHSASSAELHYASLCSFCWSVGATRDRTRRSVQPGNAGAAAARGARSNAPCSPSNAERAFLRRRRTSTSFCQLRQARRFASRQGPNISGRDLTFCHALRQIRVALPLTRPSVRVKAADLDSYLESDVLQIGIQVALESDEAFEQERGCKSASWQQRRRADGSWLAARADNGWSGCAVLGNGKAHLGELASPPPRAQCAAVCACAVALVHGAA